jgi:hypothetical protein
MGNSNAWQNGKNSRFTSGNQPKKRGRLKSVFGPLAKENDLSLDDVRKIYKNILTAKSFESLNEIKLKYPSIFTDLTIEMLRQDKLGRLIGKQVIVQNENGETVKVIGERIKSYETVKHMLDRCFGEPAKAENNADGDYEPPVFVMDELPE